MTLLTVLEELLAVIGGDDDDRLVEQLLALEPFEEQAEMVVDVADLAVVQRHDVREIARVHAGVDGVVLREVASVHVAVDASAARASASLSGNGAGAASARMAASAASSSSCDASSANTSAFSFSNCCALACTSRVEPRRTGWELFLSERRVQSDTDTRKQQHQTKIRAFSVATALGSVYV